MIHPNSIIQAAEQAERAAGTFEAAVHRLALMAEPGYGGNITALVELLGADRTAEVTKLRAALREIVGVLDGAPVDILMAHHHRDCSRNRCICSIGAIRAIVERAVGAES